MAVRSGVVTSRMSSNAYRNDVVARPIPAPVSTSTTSAQPPAESMAATSRPRRPGCRSAMSGLPEPPAASRTPTGPISATSSRLAPVSITSMTVRCGCMPSSRCRFARPRSASTAMIRSPDAARCTARLLVRTDLPVPPLPLVTQTTTGRGKTLRALSLTRLNPDDGPGAPNGDPVMSFSPRPRRRRVNTTPSSRPPIAIPPLPLEPFEFLHLLGRQGLENGRRRDGIGWRLEAGIGGITGAAPGRDLVRRAGPDRILSGFGCDRRRLGGPAVLRRQDTVGPERTRLLRGARPGAVPTVGRPDGRGESEQRRGALDDHAGTVLEDVLARHKGRDVWVA